MQVDEPCAIKLANKGPHTLLQVSKVFGVSRERIRQIETKALRKIAVAMRKVTQ
jgi:DNA-directed RNA polymerase sigma subunit (sigma70/sigma32)